MTEEGGEALTRRTLLKATAGAAGVAATSGVASAQDTDEEFDGWLDDVGNYDGSVTDATGESAMTVEVGADGNGGTFAFAPPAVRVDPGTEVTFEWVSNTHNVLFESKPDAADWSGVESIENSGFTTSHTFEAEGTYKYYCDPHRSVGMKGVIVVGGSGGGGGGGGPATWTVEMTDGNVYEPAELAVRPGDTVVWENVGSAGHTITAYEAEIPEDAEYWASGGFDSEEAARDGWPDEGVIEGGGSWEYTFETEGVHEYFCIPHETAGMKGSIEVSQDAPTPAPTPQPEQVGPALPSAAKAVGVAAAAAMASTLGLAYAFIKYGGATAREE